MARNPSERMTVVTVVMSAEKNLLCFLKNPVFVNVFTDTNTRQDTARNIVTKLKKIGRAHV